MSGDDIDSVLEDRTEDAGGDFADWWEPSEPGEELVGVLVEMHSEPREWTEEGEVPDTIRTVLSVDRGDVDAGKPVTPKQHKQLKQALAGAELGDLVRIVFTGYQKVDGNPNPMNTYDVGVVPEEDWEGLEGAEGIREVLDDYNGIEGDNRRTEPYGSGGSGGTPGGSGGSGGSVSGAVDPEVAEAAGKLQDLVSIQQGSMEVDKADQILNGVNEYDVDVEQVAVAAGFDVEDGIIHE